MHGSLVSSDVADMAFGMTQDKSQGKPQASEADFLALMAENQRLSRDLAQAREEIAQLGKLAREDGLTGLLNRRSFDIELQNALAFHQRHGESMVLILFDLDDFKGANDRHGHLGGDALLRHVAGLLTGKTRGSDVVSRIGGDEFALILRRMDSQGGTLKARQLCEALRVSPAVYGKEPINSAMSFGCSEALSVFSSATDWFAAADAALYAGKLRR